LDGKKFILEKYHRTHRSPTVLPFEMVLSSKKGLGIGNEWKLLVPKSPKPLHQLSCENIFAVCMFADRLWEFSTNVLLD
jgi:hypothetical protein